MADRSRTLARLAKIPALLLAGAGAVTTIILIGFGPHSRFSLAISVSALLIASAGLLIKQPWVDNISLAAWCVAMMVYLGDGGMELFRQFSEQREVNLKIQYAGSQGRSFDLRPQREYVLARRGQGTTIYPAFPRGLLLQAHADAPTDTALHGDDGAPLLPLYSSHAHFTEKGYRRAGELVPAELQKQRPLCH